MNTHHVNSNPFGQKYISDAKSIDRHPIGTENKTPKQCTKEINLPLSTSKGTKH